MLFPMEVKLRASENLSHRAKKFHAEGLSR